MSLFPFRRSRYQDRPDGLPSEVRSGDHLMPEVLLRRLAMVAVDAGLTGAAADMSGL